VVGPWRDQLDDLLLANEGRAARERLTLMRIFEEVRGLGYHFPPGTSKWNKIEHRLFSFITLNWRATPLGDR